MIYCRRLVTLIELLVVISILALVGGVVAIGIGKALIDQRFRTEVSLVVDQLRLAQDLMLILGTDVHMHVEGSKDNKGIDIWLVLETKLPNNLQREVLKRHQLKTIRGFTFKDKLDDAQTDGFVDVKFLSGGMVMSKGIMRLDTLGDAQGADATARFLESYICLAGYPRPIVSTDSKETAEATYTAYENGDLDKKLTDDTYAKLPEKLKQPEKALSVQEEKIDPSKTKSPPKQPQSKPPKAGEKSFTLLMG